MLTAAERQLAALTAVQKYVEHSSYADAAAAAAAVQQLVTQTTVLAAIPVFSDWLKEEQAMVSALQARERLRTLHQLLPACDLAVVAEAPAQETILAQIRELVPDHPVIAPVEATLGRQWTDLVQIARRAAADPALLGGLELAVCRGWFDLPQEVKAALTGVLETSPPVLLSGVAVRALLAAEAGAITAAAPLAREVVAVTAVGPAKVARFVDRSVLPAPMFNATCWRSVVPSVPDVLDRVSQLRDRTGRRDR
jgi:hypothetical protein